MNERYFAFLIELLTEPDSDFWKEGLQGGAGWFFVRAQNFDQAIEILETELCEQRLKLRAVMESFEIQSPDDLEWDEHIELYRNLQKYEWVIQYKTLHTYPFNAIE